MDLFDAIGRQRACRSFLPDDLDDETVGRVLQAATFAPSAENRQPWVFVVVRDPAVRAAIGAATARAWERGGRDYAASHLSPPLLDEVDRGARGGVAAAPVLIVVGGDRSRVHPSSLPASVFPAVQNLLLAATALGLGSALTTLPLAAGEELTRLTGLPDHVTPLAVVPLGRPAVALGRPRRGPFAEHTFRDRFDHPW
jgi:nitroreductase